MLRICYKSSFYHKIGFQNERKSKRFPTFLTFQANYPSLSAKHPYLPRSKKVPTFLEKPRDVFPKTSGRFRKSLSWVSNRHRYKISEGSPHKGEKKHYSMDISAFFFVYVDFLLYLCISYN